MKPKLVEGRVLDERGHPVAGAFVTIQAKDVPVPDIASVTGAKGRFQLALPKGSFSVLAVTRNGQSGEAKLSNYSHQKFSPIIYLHN